MDDDTLTLSLPGGEAVEVGIEPLFELTPEALEYLAETGARDDG